MGSITKVASGWRARWRTPEGDSRSKTFRRRVDAEQHLTTVESSKLTGSYIDRSSGRVTFGEYAQRWRDAQIHRRTTASSVETNLRVHVLPTIGDRPLGSIRPSEVQAWVRGRSEVLAPATVQVVYRLVAAIFAAAVADRIIATSPCVGIKLPKRERRRVVPLETEQVQGLADAVPERYRALIVLAASTGLRQGEAFAVSTDTIDFLRRTLTVDRQVLHVGGEPFLGPPKTEASRRVIPLPQVALDALAVHLQRFPTDGLLFTDDAGRMLRRATFNQGVWRPAVAEVGVPIGNGFHALRHYYASLLIRHGESVKVVQSRLGHASASETLDTYSHLWPDAEDRTRAAVDSVLGAVAEEQAR
jgi:integrase